MSQPLELLNYRSQVMGWSLCAGYAVENTLYTQLHLGLVLDDTVHPHHDGWLGTHIHIKLVKASYTYIHPGHDVKTISMQGHLAYGVGTQYTQVTVWRTHDTHLHQGHVKDTLTKHTYEGSLLP